jgi:hypothetical protein
MTLYYQIIETRNSESVEYRVRKAWNFFGWVISIPGAGRWLTYSFDCDSLYSFKDLAGFFNSLEHAQERANNHAQMVLRKEKRRKSTKSKIVDTIVIKS